MTDKIRVLIADDQDVIREGLRIVLNHYPDIEVADVAGDGAEAVRKAQDLWPDIVLMDLKMPVMNGIEATRRITEKLPGTQVVILTTYDTDDWVFEGVRAGAQGYLLKESGSEAVVASIRAVHRGESQLDPAIARKVLDAFRRSLPPKAEPQSRDEPPIEPLTERERGILELIAQGLSNREIAIKLSLTEGTVRNYSSKILSKLHAFDRTQAVIKAAKQGIVKL
ncbi:MAG: response regulator transcription factor [Chloroflexi bacterium]|nr:response regulator transcription factor [Chloroflexota bacterium]